MSPALAKILARVIADQNKKERKPLPVRLRVQIEGEWCNVTYIPTSNQTYLPKRNDRKSLYP